MNEASPMWLLDYISQQNCLWDVGHPLYDDYDASIFGWDDVYHHIIPEYESMNFKEKRDAHRLIHSRLKRAKHRHPELQMVNDHKKLDVDEILLSKLPDYRPTGHHICGHNYGRYCPNHGLPPYFLYEDQSLSVFRHNEDEMTRNLLKSTRDWLQKLQNDDMIFFMSLMPTISRFTEFQKLIFRSEVLKKALETSNYHLNYFTVPPPPIYPAAYMSTVPTQRLPPTAAPGTAQAPPPAAAGPSSVPPQRNVEAQPNDNYPLIDPRNIMLPPGYRPLSPGVPQQNI